jgi:hypothetical protein
MVAVEVCKKMRREAAVRERAESAEREGALTSAIVTEAPPVTRERHSREPGV